MGSSAAMIEKIYAHWNTEKAWQDLTKGSIDAERTVDIFNIYGVLEGTVKRNSDRHKEAYDDKLLVCEEPD